MNKNILKRVIAFVLSVVMALGTSSVIVMADTTPSGLWCDSGNYDTTWLSKQTAAGKTGKKSSAAFTISSAEELAAFSNMLENMSLTSSSYYYLNFTADEIDLGAHYWKPMPCKLYITGNGCVIKNMKIDSSKYTKNSSVYENAVAFISRNAYVDNLNFENADVTVTGSNFCNDTAIISGADSCYIKNCSVTGKITVSNLTLDADQEIGGLVATAGNASGIIVDCYSDVDITAENITFSSSYYSLHIGGLIGYQMCDIFNSISKGSITVKNIKSAKAVHLGGLAGSDFTKSSTQSTIVNCVTTTTISSDSSDHKIGAVCGGAATSTNGNLVPNNKLECYYINDKISSAIGDTSTFTTNEYVDFKGMTASDLNSQSMVDRLNSATVTSSNAGYPSETSWELLTDGTLSNQLLLSNHNVTFHTNGGFLDSSDYDSSSNCDYYVKSVKDGDSLTELPTPTHDSGYELEGWYTDEGLTNKVTELTNITEDTDLYAKYKMPTISSDISFDYAEAAFYSSSFSYDKNYVVSYTNDEGETVEEDLNLSDISGYVPIKEEWMGKTISLKIKSDNESVADSDVKEIKIPKRAELDESNITVYDCVNGNDGCIVISNYTKIQYMKSGNDYWTTAPTLSTSVGSIIPDLSVGTYLIRIPYDTENQIFASKNYEVKIKNAFIPTFNLDTSRITNLDANEKYVIEVNGESINAEANSYGEIEISNDWNIYGQDIEIKKADDESVSAEITVPKKYEQPKYTVKHATDSSSADGEITITALPTSESDDLVVEWKLSSGGSWTSDNVSKGENENEYKISNLGCERYYIRIRTANSDDNQVFASDAISVRIYYKEAQPTDLTINYDKMLIEGLEAGLEYKITIGEAFICKTADKDGCIPIINGYLGKTLKVSKMSTASDSTDSDAAELVIPAIPEKPNKDSITKADETVKGNNDGKISGLTTAMEYSTDGGNTWNSCEAEELTGLGAGTYAIRFKATENSFASDSIEIEILEGEEIIPGSNKEEEPNAVVDFASKMITGLVENAKYLINNVEKIADNFGKISIEDSWLGKVIEIVKVGTEGKENSDAQKLTIGSNTETPNVNKLEVIPASTDNSNDGKITGVTSDMQWSTDGTNWNDCTGSEITGLGKGTYFIRTKATNDAFASEAVKISVGVKPSENAKLKDIVITGAGIDVITINGDETTKSIDVDNNVNSISINANAEHENASISINGEKLENGSSKNIELKTGVNEIVIEVTAEDGSKSIYTITITRKGKTEQSTETPTETTSKNTTEATTATTSETTTEATTATTESTTEATTATTETTTEATTATTTEVTTRKHSSSGGGSSSTNASKNNTNNNTSADNNSTDNSVDNSDNTNADTDNSNNNVVDKPNSSNSSANITDISGKWYEKSVRRLSEKNIISGYNDGEFKGQNPINRAEFSVMVSKILGLEPAENSKFVDVADSYWAAGYIEAASESGIIFGRGDDKFDPTANITRQEAMAIIERAVNYAQVNGIENSGSIIGQFNDLDKVYSWAEKSVEFNVNNGLIVGDNGSIKPLENITRAESATVLCKFMDLVEEK